MEKIVVEVCCGSVDDAVRAAEAGADRRSNERGVRGRIDSFGRRGARDQARVNIPVVCMIRPRAEFCYTALEFETMLQDTQELAKAGADSFAVGFLTEEGRLDEKRCKNLGGGCGGKGWFSPRIRHHEKSAGGSPSAAG